MLNYSSSGVAGVGTALSVADGTEDGSITARGGVGCESVLAVMPQASFEQHCGLAPAGEVLAGNSDAGRV